MALTSVNFWMTKLPGSFCDQENTFTVGLEDCTHVPAMVEKMKKAGFSDKELEMICRGNWMNLIQRVIG